MVIRSQIRIGLTILFSLVFLWIAYPSRYYFLNDDFFHIPLAAQKNFVHGTLLRPVSDLSLWFDHRVWAKVAFGYHLTNTLIHLTNVMLIYVLARHLFREYGGRATAKGGAGDGARSEAGNGLGDGEGRGSVVELKAWLAALFFLLYGFHSEPVFWIIGRGGSLTTVFFLAASICYLKRDGPSRYFFFSLLFFCIGLFVYESIWIFPLVALFLSVAAIRRKGKAWSAERVYLMWISGLFVLYLLFRLSQTGSLAGSYEVRNLPSGNFFRLLYNYNTLFARSFLPPMAGGKWFLLFYAILWFLLGLVIVRIVRKRKANVLLWLLAACLLVSLLPAITLGIDTHNTESERFIYLPSVFCVLLTTEMIFLVAKRPGPAARMLLLFIALHAFQLRQSSLSYQYGGKIARRSLEFIDSKTRVRTLYLLRMPAQYQGALIFRSGLEPAIEWIDSGLAYRDLAVLSKTELLERRDSLICVEQDLRQLAVSIGATIRADTADRGWQVELPDTSFTFLPGRDRIFYWTDSSLVKIIR